MTRRSLIEFANRLLAPLSVALENPTRLTELRAAETRLHWQTRMGDLQPNPETLPRGQIGQDLFALFANDFKRNGFFVEFGAADGVTFSNTFLLERSFGWTGILAEPARSWHERLRQNRTAVVDTRCVWPTSGESLEFSEPRTDALLSAPAATGDVDGHFAQRQDGIVYEVETVSLNDLLEQHQAGPRIDFLSLDTEGSEVAILEAFDFRPYEIGAISVEHAYDKARQSQIHDLLAARGFVRVFADLSLWDDWYVSR